MAEIATIARPYAEALFKAAGADAAPLKDQLSALSMLAGDAQLRQFADDPKVAPAQVFDLVAGIALQKGLSLDTRVGVMRSGNSQIDTFSEWSRMARGWLNTRAPPATARSSIQVAVMYSKSKGGS